MDTDDTSATPPTHEVLGAVLQVRSDALQVLLWRRARSPHRGRWALPGGTLRHDEDVGSSIRRQLAEKVDVKQLSHVEQLAVFSDPRRVPGPRTIATAFLALIPSDVAPHTPDDTRWHPVAALPHTAFDHVDIVNSAHDRLRAKLSYTNLGFALAPSEFTIATLRDLYSAALGYPVAATNLQRVLSRRGTLVPTGHTRPSGHTGGRPPALFAFTNRALHVTDPVAVLKPPAQE
ncbi:MAG: NUDIX hydrolase [Nocardioidaceae bacterium]